jgi:hypothetical protein
LDLQLRDETIWLRKIVRSSEWNCATNQATKQPTEKCAGLCVPSFVRLSLIRFIFFWDIRRSKSFCRTCTFCFALQQQRA